VQTDKQRERAAFRYIGALERGDFTALAALLREAERDPALARMFAEIDQAYAAELDRPQTNSRHGKEKTMTALSMPMGRALPKQTAPSSFLLFAAMLALTFAVLLTLRGMIPSAPQPDRFSGAPMLQASPSPEAPPSASASVSMSSLCYQVTDSVLVMRASAAPDARVSGTLTPDMVFRILRAQSVNERTWLYIAVGETGALQGWIDAGGAAFRIKLCEWAVPASAALTLFPSTAVPTAAEVLLTPTVMPTAGGAQTGSGIVLPSVELPTVILPSVGGSAAVTPTETVEVMPTSTPLSPSASMGNPIPPTATRTP
jgi:hypothetical protein